MAIERQGLTRGFAALQYRDFRLLFFSSLVSSIGGQLQAVTNTWQIYQLTGSALQIGLTGIVRAVPILLFSLIGGVFADRMDRRKMIMITQLCNGAFALFLAVDTISGSVQVWHIYSVTFLNSSLMALSGPGRRAIIAGLVPRHQLMNAFALNQSVMQLSRIFSPSLGGVLIAFVGLPISYFINGAATVITAFWLTFIRIQPLPARPPSSPLEDLVEGLRFIRKRSIIFVLLGTDLGQNLFGSYQPLLPIFADQFGLGATGFGLLSSAPSIGALIGAAIVMSLGDIRYKGFLIVGAILTYCGCLVGLALSPWFALSMVMVAGLGFCDAMQSTPRNAVIQTVTPDELRGRVSAFQGMLVTGGPGLGQTAMGAMTTAMGAPFALIAGALVSASVNIAVLIKHKDLRSPDLAMDTDAEEPVAGPGLTAASASETPARP